MLNFELLANMKLSIIVPVYNVEKYIRPCIESIFKQGLDDSDFEVIIVNDGTKDCSIEIIADIIKEHNNITVINQDNQGLSVARNNGMNIARGEYIQFVDSDDLLIDNCVPYLLNKAISTKADLIVADYIKMDDSQIVLFQNQHFIQNDGNTQKKTGEELFLQDLNPHYCYVWRTLYKRDFLKKNNLCFIPNICFEDVPFTHQCYLKANLCLRINWLFVIYRKGHESISNSFNMKKGRDFCVAISKTWEISHDNSLSSLVKQKIQNDVFANYSKIIYSISSCNTISYSEKISLIYFLRENAPNMYFKNGFKQRIVSFLYHRMPSIYLTFRIIYAMTLQNYLWKLKKKILN